MVLEVLNPGPATTVQDNGRPGFGVYGVPEGGAMDRGLLAGANRLAGNRAGAAALEFVLKGPRLRWRGRTRLRCVVAADTMIEVNLGSGDQLDGGSLRRRAYGYVAVRGGLQVPLLMGGRGTCLPGGFGGIYGRELRAGDLLPVGAAPIAQVPGPRPPVAVPLDETADGAEAAAGWRTVRVLPGQRSRGWVRAFAELLRADWRAGAANRVGIKLQGPSLNLPAPSLSQPIPPGAIQVTGAGEPILLLRDHPTIGGYPVVAVAAAADLDACAQLRPGDRVRFVSA